MTCSSCLTLASGCVRNQAELEEALRLSAMDVQLQDEARNAARVTEDRHDRTRRHARGRDSRATRSGRRHRTSRHADRETGQN